MGDLGLLGVDAPEEYGGLNLDKVTACIIAEGVQRGGSASFDALLEFKLLLGLWESFFLGHLNKKKGFYPIY